jgi:MFS family permease
MNRNVLITGLVSFFTDISSEMIYPLVPLYLTAMLGATPAILGIIEGIAESLASFLKILSGNISDRLKLRKPVAIAGYGLSAISKIFFVLATGWTGIFAGRVSDRFGKGIRTAPRDALIAESSQAASRGKSFGFQRALDTAGAVLGIVIAYLLFTRYNGEYKLVFLLALIPAFIGVACLFLAKETGGRHIAGTVKYHMLSWHALDKRLRLFIVVTFVFNLGNSSNQFLLLRADDYGFSAAQVILLYLLMNVTYLVASYPSGILSDKIGRRSLLVLGYGLYGLVYFGFSFANMNWQFILLFAFYGIYLGITDGIEKALMADIAPSDQRATIYGLQAAVVGMALLPASILAGVLWDVFGVAAPFLFGGVTGLFASLVLWRGLKGA